MIINPVRHTLTLVCALILLLSAFPHRTLAQDDTQRFESFQHFESLALGVAFDMPAGWQVVETDGKLLAAAPGDVSAVQQGALPQHLAVRMTFGTFDQLDITDATQLPDLMARLIPSGIAAPVPEPVQWENTSGYRALVTLPDEGITTRIMLLAIAGGRVVVVRGLAPLAAWEQGAGTQFETLVQTLIFSLPEREENFLKTITANDGGVLWHFQTASPDAGRDVIAGGIAYDPFDVMYLAVGPGGVLALNMNTGSAISYLGPWYHGNFVDVATGPDLKLYLANVADNTDQALMVVDRAGNWTRGWGTRGDGDGQFAPGMPQTLTVTSDNSVWTVSEDHSSGIRNRLYRFDTFGNLLLTIDLAAINEDLVGVRIDHNPKTGALYLVGAQGNLNVIDANGQPFVVNLAAEVLQDLTPADIAIAPNDNIILALRAPGLDEFGFLELSVAGRLLDVFGAPYDDARSGPFLAGEYRLPEGLISGPDGTLYWTETNTNAGFMQVQRFSFTGDGRLQLGEEMLADQQLETAADLVGSSDPARGGGSLVFGQSVRGALNNRYPTHRWTFEGRTGDHVIITMTDASGTGLLDPKLSLFTVDGSEIAANDDVGAIRPAELGERDALIDFILPRDGLFTIETGRFGGRGDYILSLELVTEQ